VGGHVAQPFFGGVLHRHVAADHQQFQRACGVVVGRDAQLVPDFDIGSLDAHFQQLGRARFADVECRGQRRVVAIGDQLARAVPASGAWLPMRAAARWLANSIWPSWFSRNTTSPASSMRLSNS
jgi:hypothetical protein